MQKMKEDLAAVSDGTTFASIDSFKETLLQDFKTQSAQEMMATKTSKRFTALDSDDSDDDDSKDEHISEDTVLSHVLMNMKKTAYLVPKQPDSTMENDKLISSVPIGILLAHLDSRLSQIEDMSDKEAFLEATVNKWIPTLEASD